MTMYDPSITTHVDYAEARAKSPIKPGESRAAFRARVARELFASGDAWTAYQVLQNTNVVDYFFVYSELRGAYGSVEETAQVVQERYEWMLAREHEEIARRISEEKAREEFWAFVHKWRRILTLGRWS